MDDEDLEMLRESQSLRTKEDDGVSGAPARASGSASGKGKERASYLDDE